MTKTHGHERPKRLFAFDHLQTHFSGARGALGYSCGGEFLLFPRVVSLIRGGKVSRLQENECADLALCNLVGVDLVNEYPLLQSHVLGRLS